MVKIRTCNKCGSEIGSGQEFIKLQSNMYDGKKIVYKNMGDLCLCCYENLTRETIQ